MTDLAAGTQVLAGDFPPSVGVQDNTSQANISSTTYISGSPILEVEFIVPTTGRIRHTVAAGMRNNGANNARIFCAPRISEVGGVLIISPTAGRYGIGLAIHSTDYEYHSRTVLIEGLEPGRRYVTRFMYQVSGNDTCDITTRSVHVVPAT